MSETVPSDFPRHAASVVAATSSFQAPAPISASTANGSDEIFHPKPQSFLAYSFLDEQDPAMPLASTGLDGLDATLLLPPAFDFDGVQQAAAGTEDVAAGLSPHFLDDDAGSAAQEILNFDFSTIQVPAVAADSDASSSNMAMAFKSRVQNDLFFGFSYDALTSSNMAGIMA